MHKPAKCVVAMGIVRGKGVARQLISIVMGRMLTTTHTAGVLNHEYKARVLHQFTIRASTAYTQALSTYFTLLSPLLCTVSTGPIKSIDNKN